MSELLKRYLGDAQPTVSNEEYTDGETALTVHVAPEASVDAVVAETAEAEIKQNEIERDAEALVEAQAAMEAYANLLEESLDGGGISAQSARFLQIGLERYETLLGLDEPLTPSVEAFGGSASRGQSTRESLERVKRFLQEAWETIKRALKALINAVLDTVKSATQAADKLGKRAKELNTKASAMRTTHVVEDGAEFPLDNPGKLYADGQWLGEDPLVVAGIVDEVMKSYPQDVIKYAADVASAVRRYDPTAEDAEGQLRTLLNLEPAFARFDSKQVVGRDARFPAGVPVMRGETMPGNVAVYISQPDKSQGDTEVMLKRLLTDLRVELLPVPDAANAPASHTVQVADLATLQARAKQILAVTEAIQKSKPTTDAIKKAVEELIKAGDDLTARAGKQELTPEQQRTVNAVLRGLVAVERMVGKSVAGVLSHAVRTLNLQLSIVERSLALYQPKA